MGILGKAQKRERRKKGLIELALRELKIELSTSTCHDFNTL